MIEGISHMGVLVRNLDETLGEFEKVLGLQPDAIKTRGTNRIAFIPIGGDEIELIQPFDRGSRLGIHLAERGEGVHHIALETEDIVAELSRLRRMDVYVQDGILSWGLTVSG
jgi:methylmalonyl-CoA/ethylmalonyl-CoA epimerase